MLTTPSSNVQQNPEFNLRTPHSWRTRWRRRRHRRDRDQKLSPCSFSSLPVRPTNLKDCSDEQGMNKKGTILRLRILIKKRCHLQPVNIFLEIGTDGRHQRILRRPGLDVYQIEECSWIDWKKYMHTRIKISNAGNPVIRTNRWIKVAEKAELIQNETKQASKTKQKQYKPPVDNTSLRTRCNNSSNTSQSSHTVQNYSDNGLHTSKSPVRRSTILSSRHNKPSTSSTQGVGSRSLELRVSRSNQRPMATTVTTVSVSLHVVESWSVEVSWRRLTLCESLDQNRSEMKSQVRTCSYSAIRQSFCTTCLNRLRYSCCKLWMIRECVTKLKLFCMHMHNTVL